MHSKISTLTPWLMIDTICIISKMCAIEMRPFLSPYFEAADGRIETDREDKLGIRREYHVTYASI